MRQSWTDDRLDDLNRNVDQRFGKVEGEIRLLRAEMKESLTELRKEMQANTAALRGEIQTTAAELRGEIQATAAELRGEIQATAAELRGEIAEIGRAFRFVYRTMFLLMVGLCSALIGLLGLSLDRI